MIRNNVIALVCTLIATFLVLMLANGAMSLSPSSVYHVGQRELVLQTLLAVVTLLCFILIGRYWLKGTGSIWKNICSVILPFIIGLYCAISVAATPHQLNLLVLFYGGYSTPFIAILSPSKLSIVPYENSLSYGVIFSFIPSLLYFLGLQWRSRFKA